MKNLFKKQKQDKKQENMTFPFKRNGSEFSYSKLIKRKMIGRLNVKQIPNLLNHGSIKRLISRENGTEKKLRLEKGSSKS